MCAHMLGALTCGRPDSEHDTNARGGHVYAASAGPDLSRQECADE